VIIRLTFLLLVGLTVWVVVSAVRIERLNAEAGYYLPRHDDDGKWRISRESTPRDQLRGLVSSIGLLQYLFAPLVAGLAAFHLSRREPAARRLLAACSGVVGIAALGLAFYRGYFSSLGW
jgi:hypothetical protein